MRTKICFSSKENHALTTELLKCRFNKDIAKAGKLQYHAFIPSQDEKVQLKMILLSEEHDIFSTGKKHKPWKRRAKT